MSDTKDSSHAKDDDRAEGTQDCEAAETDGEPEPIVIRKYANRRLYNMAESSYVTLDDLAQLVRDGEDFGVFDAKSGEDITGSVLLQIIVEQEAGEQQLLPIGFLRELISLYDDPIQAILPDYLDAAMQALLENRDTLRRHQVIDDATGFEQLVRVSMEAFEQSLDQMQTGENGAGSAISGSDVPGAGAISPGTLSQLQTETQDARDDQDEIRKDLNVLQRQLMDMQAQIERLSKVRK